MVEQIDPQPIAYLHTLHMEGGQTYERLLDWDGVDEDEPRRTAFGFPGRDYSEEYPVTTTPLYTRQAAEARILARMREPDAAMVEAVAKAIWGDEPGADEYWTAFEDHANRALAAAADHMEAGDAG